MDKKADISIGMKTVGEYLSKRDLFSVKRALQKEGDDQSAELLRKVYVELAERLSPKDSATVQALNRLSKISRLKGPGARNSIFKMADLLGIKLPSMIFASNSETGFSSQRTSSPLAPLTPKTEF